ncbi:MAG: endonuclease domain-containing protein [Nitrospinales bacterium]
MKKVFNRKDKKTIRQDLRNNMPETERLLWAKLRGKQLGGYKFRRQYGVDQFVLDFYCPKIKLGIEIDGDSHFNKNAETYDRERSRVIQSYGIKILRFNNNEVHKNIDGVLETILENSPEL